MKSSINIPTSLFANAVITPVFIPKHLRKPRTTLYSPPPSHARNCLAVRILPSPGSRRNITSPKETASNLHSFAGLKFKSIFLLLLFHHYDVCLAFTLPRHLILNSYKLEYNTKFEPCFTFPLTPQLVQCFPQNLQSAPRKIDCAENAALRGGGVLCAKSSVCLDCKICKKRAAQVVDSSFKTLMKLLSDTT